MFEKTILLVDDEKETLMFLANTLKRLGYKVITASSGAEAITKTKDNSPDLILLDVLMPGISGDDVAVILSQDPDTANIPIVFLTGIISKEEEPHSFF